MSGPLASDCPTDTHPRTDNHSFDLVEEANMKQLKLFVYNVDTDSCREVTVIPNAQWGGGG